MLVSETGDLEDWLVGFRPPGVAGPRAHLLLCLHTQCARVHHCAYVFLVVYCTRVFMIHTCVCAHRYVHMLDIWCYFEKFSCLSLVRHGMWLVLMACV